MGIQPVGGGSLKEVGRKNSSGEERNFTAMHTYSFNNPGVIVATFWGAYPVASYYGDDNFDVNVDFDVVASGDDNYGAGYIFGMKLAPSAGDYSVSASGSQYKQHNALSTIAYEIQ